ncbi:MAG TPA: cyclic nucleotide-binding domain-containing protein [Xanthobacteraceae bacterium]|jgi:CRP-like cAMP-binding protein
MPDAWTLLAVAGVGLFTTSAVMIGATLGLYLPLSKKLLAYILAFASGVLIASLGIELAFHAAEELHHKGFAAPLAWGFVGAGFVTGVVVYYTASRFLDRRGAAVRSATRFREYMLERKKDEIELLAKSDLLRHLPPEAIEDVLTRVDRRKLKEGEILFHAGAPGDALYIVAQGNVLVLQPAKSSGEAEVAIAKLGPGAAFGEMALLSGAPRTATIRAETETDLLRIDKQEFDRMVASDRQLGVAVQRLSHERAITNLASGATNPDQWSKVALGNLENLSRRETDRMMSETSHGAGLAIMLGDLLDTVPGLVVVGASFTSFASMSVTVMMGIFIGGIPESAASAALLKKSGFSAKQIYGLWIFTVCAGILSAIAGKVFIGSSESLLGIFAEAMAGGSLLALVSHAMIPEALHQGGSVVVLPTVAGFLAALYLILAHTLG